MKCNNFDGIYDELSSGRTHATKQTRERNKWVKITHGQHGANDPLPKSRKTTGEILSGGVQPKDIQM